MKFQPSEQKNFNMLANTVVSVEANTKVAGRSGEQKNLNVHEFH